MSTELLLLARELFVWMLVLSLQLACILLLRKPLARYFGATVAYRLWLLPLLWLPLHWVDWATIEWSLPEFAWFAGDSPRGSVSWFPMVSQGVDIVLDLPEWAFSQQGASRGLWLAAAALWFGVALVLLASIALKTRRFARQLPHLAPRSNTGANALVESPFPPALPVRHVAGLQSPALYGVLQPQLLLPADFSQRFAPRQRALILAHEAVHYRRRDNFWNLVACGLRLLFWFNPLLHLAWHKFRLDQEMSCDEQALRQAAQDEGKQYARTLIESAVWNTQTGAIGKTDALPTLTSWGRLSEIKERTRMIQQHLKHKPHSTAGKFLLPVLAVVFFTLTASLSGQLENAVAAEPQETLSRAVYESIERVMELRDTEEYAEAKEILDALEVRLNNGELNGRETHVVYQFQANLAQIEDDYARARDYYRKILDLPGLSEQDLAQTLTQTGALSFALEDYRSAIDYFQQLLETGPEADEAQKVHLRLAFAYYQLQEWEQAIPHAEAARNLGDNSRNTLQLLQYLYDKTGQTNKVSELAAAIANLPPSAQVIIEEDERASDEYLPVVVIQPRYPNRALQERIEGWAQVSFTVDETGSVVDPVIVDSSPEDIFDEASLQAVSRFKFEPRVVDGNAVQTPGVRYVFRFDLND